MDNNEKLLQAFRIKPEDLQMNRAGRLGPTQARNLLNSGIMNLAGAFLIGVLLAAILYWVVDKPLVPVQWILCIILFAIVLIVGARYFQQTRAAVADGRVESLVGPVRVVSRGRGGWYLYIGEQSFQLPVRLGLIQQNAVYRVYIARHSHSIVAMEPANPEELLNSNKG